MNYLRLVERILLRLNGLPLLAVQIFGGFADTFGKIRLGGCRLQLGSLASTYRRLWSTQAMMADNAAPHTNDATAIPTTPMTPTTPATSPTQHGHNSHGPRLTTTNDKIMQKRFHICNVLKITSKISTHQHFLFATSLSIPRGI